MSFIEINYLITVLFYLIGYISDINYGNISYIISALLMSNILLLTLFFIKYNINIFLNKNARNIFIFMLLIFVVYQILNINTQYTRLTLITCVKNFLLIVNIYMFSLYIYYKKCEERIILITYIITALFISVMYLLNFDGFAGLKEIAFVFNSQLRYRNSFGLFHYNSTGSLSYMVLLLSLYLFKNPLCRKIEIRFTIICLNFIVSIVLISTASRTSITSLILFYLVFYIIGYIKKFKHESKIYKYFKKLFITLTIIIFTVMIIEFIPYVRTLDFISIVSYTNRISNFTINIPILYNNNKQWFGMGIYNSFYDLYGGTIYIDNWYLYMFLTCGIVGLIFSVFLLIKVYISILKDNRETLLEHFVLSYFISQLYFNIFETQIFHERFLNCYIIWILLFTTIFYKEKVVKNIETPGI